MLYDDDRSVSPFESIGPNDTTQWLVPGVDPAHLQRFGGADRVLIVLSMADGGAGGSFPGDQVFDAAGLSWDRDTISEVIGVLLATGLIETQEWDDDLYLSITDYGEERVSALIGT